jgi:hypothetical protein
MNRTPSIFYHPPARRKWKFCWDACVLFYCVSLRLRDVKSCRRTANLWPPVPDGRIFVGFVASHSVQSVGNQRPNPSSTRAHPPQASFRWKISLDYFDIQNTKFQADSSFLDNEFVISGKIAYNSMFVGENRELPYLGDAYFARLKSDIY